MNTFASRFTVLVACVAVLTAAACSKSTKSDNSNGSTTATSSASASSNASGTGSSSPAYLTQPTALPVTQPLSKKPASGIKIAFLNPGVGYAQQYLQGLQQAAQVLGWTIENLTVQQTNPATTVSAMTSAINGGAKYVVIGATDAPIYASVVPLAKSKGVIILDTNSTNPAIAGVVQPVLSSTMAIQGGLETGQALLADAKAQGLTAHVGEVTVPIFASVLAPIQTGLKQAVATCSACSISPIPIAAQAFTGGQFAPTIVSYLQAHPDVNYLYFDASPLESGLTNALRVAGLKAPRMFGFGAQSAEIKAIQAGDQQGWGVDPSVVHGWILADVAARLSVGDDPNVWTKPLYYVLEKSNSAGVDPDNLEYPVGYQEMFKTLWKA